MLLNLMALPLKEVESHADLILKRRDPDELATLDSQLGELIGSLMPNPPFNLPYRWALTAEKRGLHDVAFDRWLLSHELWPDNEWFINRCFEEGMLAGKWEKVLPLCKHLMPLLVRRGGKLPEKWAQSLLRLCVTSLGAPEIDLDRDRRALREAIWAQMFVESERHPRVLTYNCLAIELLELEATDSVSARRACARVEHLIRVPELSEMPVPTIILYLLTSGRSARPDLPDIVRNNLYRLDLTHLEIICGHDASFKAMVSLASLLEEALPGVIINEMSSVISGTPTEPNVLVARLRHALERKADTSKLGYEVRFAEQWVARLENRLNVRRTVSRLKLQNLRPLAVCIYGQMRGFQRVQADWKRFFGDLEYDLYISTWRLTGRRELHPGPGFSTRVLPSPLAIVFDEMCDKHSGHSVRVRYPAFFSLLQTSNEVTVSELTDIYPNLISYRIDDDDEPAYSSLSSQEKMFLRGKSSLDLCLASGRNYARVLRIRPDITIPSGTIKSLLSDEILAGMNDGIVWSDGALRFETRHGFLMGDRVTMGTPEAMIKYSSIWDHRHLARPGMSGMEGALIAHRSLGFHMMMEGITVRKLPVQFGLMLDPPFISTADLRSAIMEDARSRMDEVDRAFIKALDICQAEDAQHQAI